MEQSFEEVQATIAEEYAAINVREVVRSQEWDTFSCLDPLSHHGGAQPEDGEHRLAGSVLKVWYEGALEELFAERAGQSVVINVHVGCVAAFNLHEDYQSRSGQRDLWARIQETAEGFAEAYDCQLTFNVFEGGGAWDHMQD